VLNPVPLFAELLTIHQPPDTFLVETMPGLKLTIAIFAAWLVVVLLILLTMMDLLCL
jgi:hypothetical protein